ncbi:hypothetical protein CASFOL_022867 [Castilleja foliolosa]|uniref:Uncharacterized protein n=1 Tax=Castilleja foliolosa TaxID=1961234 RepID=A0ABD3CXH6_9LAMI
MHMIPHSRYTQYKLAHAEHMICAVFFLFMRWHDSSINLLSCIIILFRAIS